MGYYVNYGESRWKIYCGSELSATEQKAVYELYGALREYLPYIITVVRSESEITEKDHLIYIGTLKSNPALSRLALSGAYVPETRKEGYSLKVMPSVEREGVTDIIVQGADPVGVLYGVYELEHAYFDTKLKYEGYHFEKQHRPLLDPCTDFEASSAPAIINRGLWSWGHKIYDYKGYLDNMARCRMNMLVMWNDFAPLNAREIVEYAHTCGVRIIWGFTCAWGEDVAVDPTDPAEAEKWGKRVLEVYEREYAELGGDGVYFQCFTETTNQEIGGVPIAKLATDWVNYITNVLHKAHPELYVQFGLHATSIKENYTLMSGLQNDVTPVWEDCGAFPFHYDPRREGAAGVLAYGCNAKEEKQGEDPAKEAPDPRRDGIAKTLAYSCRLMEMAKGSGRFGVVLKGFTVLPWKKFEHYKGNIIVGKTDRLARQRILSERQFYWKFAEPYWINHAPDLKNFCKAVATAEFTDSTVTALVEDGMFEGEISPAIGIYAELLWNPDANVADVIEKIYHSEHFGH